VSGSAQLAGGRKWLAHVRSLGVLLWVALCSGCLGEKPLPPEVFSGISLTDQDSLPIDRGALSGRVIALNFMFTSCASVCPRQTRALVEVRAELPEAVRERVLFLSVSVDPDHDQPAVLKQFARTYGADSAGWSFALSDEKGTRLLGSRLAAFEPGVEPAPSAHSGAVYLFDRAGRLVQRYHGAPIDVAHLAREIIAVDQLKPPGARLASK
jgi:protein SCO1/2